MYFTRGESYWQKMAMYVSKCCFLLLVSYFVLQWCCTVTCDCIPPEEPIKCFSGDSNCTITNSQGAFPDRSVCRAADAVYPTTEAELISAVATATMKKRKMKVYIYICLLVLLVCYPNLSIQQIVHALDL